jgi:hypothetical protein
MKLHPPVTSSYQDLNIPQALCSQTSSNCVILLIRETTFHTNTKNRYNFYFVDFNIYVFRQYKIF